jgi:hypothetical protein
MTDLASKLEAAGLSVASLDNRLLVSEFGGRILGLLPDGQTNLFWINPNAVRRESVSAWRLGKGWSNLGGERAWISPEIDTNVPDPERFAESYAVPAQIDPGNYTLLREKDGLVLSQEFSLRWLRTGQTVGLSLERMIRPAATPPFSVPAGISFAGYSLVSRLSALTPLGAARPAVWNLIQTPGGGTVMAKVRPGAQPVSFINAAKWSITGQVIQTQARTETSFKWSLRASQCAGRFMYFQPLADGRAGLVVRDFPVTEDADYSDCPCHTPHATGHMCQVYVDDGALGGFAELEFHAPALRHGVRETNETHCSTWGFVGPAEAIRSLNEELTR